MASKVYFRRIANIHTMGAETVSELGFARSGGRSGCVCESHIL